MSSLESLRGVAAYNLTDQTKYLGDDGEIHARSFASRVIKLLRLDKIPFVRNFFCKSDIIAATESIKEKIQVVLLLPYPDANAYQAAVEIANKAALVANALLAKKALRSPEKAEFFKSHHLAITEPVFSPAVVLSPEDAEFLEQLNRDKARLALLAEEYEKLKNKEPEPTILELELWWSQKLLSETLLTMIIDAEDVLESVLGRAFSTNKMEYIPNILRDTKNDIDRAIKNLTTPTPH